MGAVVPEEAQLVLLLVGLIMWWDLLRGETLQMWAQLYYHLIQFYPNKQNSWTGYGNWSGIPVTWEVEAGC